jgi:hypothetical protein
VSVNFVVPHPHGWDRTDDPELRARMIRQAKLDGQLVPWVGMFSLGVCSCVISLGAGPRWTISISVASHRPSDGTCEMLRRCCHIETWDEIEGSDHARYFQIKAEAEKS